MCPESVKCKKGDAAVSFRSRVRAEVAELEIHADVAVQSKVWLLDFRLGSKASPSSTDDCPSTSAMLW